MKKITVFGTITKDIIHFKNESQALLGGVSWFAAKLSPILKSKVSIVTNVGQDFPMTKIPLPIRNNSWINSNHINTSMMDIFPLKKGVPAKVKHFTGRLRINKNLTGDVAIISPLFQEITTKDILLLKKRFDLLVIDLQGFTRPKFKKDINLSDLIKKQPLNIKSLCKLADLIKISDNELDVFAGDNTLSKIKNLHRFGVSKVIVTKGKMGCIFSDSGRMRRFKTKPVLTDNTIGAGDMFILLVVDNIINGSKWTEAITNTQKTIINLLKEKV